MRIINSKEAPQAVGCYSQAIKTETMLFLAGQIPLDPTTMRIEAQSVTEQTKQVCANLAAVLAEAGVYKEQVVKTTVFLTDMKHYEAMNTVYEAFFAGHKPARTAVVVVQLPHNALVEIEAIAVINETMVK